MTGPTPAWIAKAYEDACLAELQACKPGNVHIHADGHRMQVADFQRSATESAPVIAERGAPVGRRVLGAVRATIDRVGTNTNLGIVLLCAPLATAAERGGDLFGALREVLRTLTVDDASQVYEAIRLASPAGLGEVPSHDVRSAPEVDLRAAMQAAAAHDRIARAYLTDFEDIWEVGLPALTTARHDGLPGEWCTTAVYLAFLAAIPDTHIARKYGLDVAEAVREEADALRRSAPLSERSLQPLLRFDRDLKERRLNPGTSADFTVATLFADLLKSPADDHLRLVGR